MKTELTHDRNPDYAPFYTASARCPLTHKLMIAEDYDRHAAMMQCARMLAANMDRLGRERRNQIPKTKRRQPVQLRLI